MSAKDLSSVGAARSVGVKEKSPPLSYRPHRRVPPLPGRGGALDRGRLGGGRWRGGGAQPAIQGAVVEAVLCVWGGGRAIVWFRDQIALL